MLFIPSVEENRVKSHAATKINKSGNINMPILWSDFLQIYRFNGSYIATA